MQCYPTKTNEKPSQCCESKSPGGRQILCCFHSFSSILLIIKTHSRGFRGLTAFSAILLHSQNNGEPHHSPSKSTTRSTWDYSHEAESQAASPAVPHSASDQHLHQHRPDLSLPPSQHPYSSYSVYSSSTPSTFSNLNTPSPSPSPPPKTSSSSLTLVLHPPSLPLESCLSKSPCKDPSLLLR